MQIEENEIRQEATAKKDMSRAGIFFFLLMILEIPVSVIIALVQVLVSPSAGSLVSILMTQGYLLLGAVVFMLATKKKPGKDLYVKRYRLSSFFLTLVLLITTAPMASFLNVISQFFVKNEAGNAILDVTQTVPVWLGIPIIGCLPGVIEETLYRGIMFRAFRKRSLLTGVAISSLSFGLMHMNFNQIPYAIYLGIVFALVVEATGSIVSSMVMHMIFNGMNTLYLYVIPKLYEILGQYNAQYADFDLSKAMAEGTDPKQLMASAVMLFPIALGGVVLSVLLIKAIAHLNGRTISFKRTPEEQKENCAPVTVCLILGWIFCIGISIMNAVM